MGAHPNRPMDKPALSYRAPNSHHKPQGLLFYFNYHRRTRFVWCRQHHHGRKGPAFSSLMCDWRFSLNTDFRRVHMEREPGIRYHPFNEDFGKRNMPGKHARRHFSQLSEFERDLIIRMRTAGWSTRRVARQVDRSECAVRNCWEQWTREGTHAWKTGSEANRKTMRRGPKDRAESTCGPHSDSFNDMSRRRRSNCSTNNFQTPCRSKS
ncbi:transposable element Tcb2 transposase [Trichonephila clavipes]|nr:transposable element Tcb2 transposase [Trichonephila clavipes]